MAYWGSYLECLGCLETTLLVELGGGGGGGGLRDLSMADGLVILVDGVNLNEVSPLVEWSWVWRQWVQMGVADL